MTDADKQYIQHGTIDASANYGQRGPINCTVSPVEVVKIRQAELERTKQHVANHEEYKRVKKGSKTIAHMLPPEERYSKNGSI
jgi:hypothetical protein